MGGNELKYIEEAFASNWIAPLGPNVDGFEQQLRAITQTEAAVALNSGTGALHLALRVLGVQPGDVVLCQSMTFAASAFPIVYEKAEPVFIDSEETTWNMDPALLEEALAHYKKQGRRVAAIIPVHLYGMPAQMDRILQLAAEYEVPVIEDAAEALGSRYQDRPCGSLGTVGILSFNGNKIITTSGGGAMVSMHAQLVEQVRFLSTQAREPQPHYEHKEVGFNYRMSNVTAGIGRGQLDVLADRVARRRAIHDYYQEQLQQLAGIRFLAEPANSFSNRWLTTIVVDPAASGGVSREAIRLRLDEHNIESRPLWKPMHQQPVFDECRAFCNGNSDLLFQNGLCLPSGSAMTNTDLDRVCSLVAQCWHEATTQTT